MMIYGLFWAKRQQSEQIVRPWVYHSRAVSVAAMLHLSCLIFRNSTSIFGVTGFQILFGIYLITASLCPKQYKTCLSSQNWWCQKSLHISVYLLQYVPEAFLLYHALDVSLKIKFHIYNNALKSIFLSEQLICLRGVQEGVCRYRPPPLSTLSVTSPVLK